MPSIPQITSEDLFARVANTLAQALPPDLKAQCDKILGENPESRERWSIYQTTLTHYQNRQGVQE